MKKKLFHAPLLVGWRKKMFRIMRITFILVCCMVFYASASSYSQNTKLSLNTKNSTIVELIRDIESQSKFVFLYQAEDLNLNKRINADFKDATIHEILDVALKGEGVSYEIFDRQILISKEGASAPGNAMQQARNVSGIVTDKSGQPIPGVSVVVKGTTIGTITDADGKYALSNVPGNAILQLSFVGMKTQDVVVGNKTMINAIMEEETIGLDEVVAIGYGTQSKRTLTTSVAKFDGEALENIPITNIGEGLKGRIAGVRITSGNSQPGSDVTIRVRGGSSINKSNAPLILVDGVERSFNGLDPNDIESIDVLKDAASSAIYGSRASNGVILISTKKGKKGAPRITFEAFLASQEVSRKYDFLNAKDYLTILRPAVAVGPRPGDNFVNGLSASSGNDETSIYTTRYLAEGETVPVGYKSMTDPIDPTKTLIFQDNSFQNEVYNTALWQNYYIGVDGGSDNIKYSTSLGYTDDEGVAIGTGFSRYNFRTNTDIKISEKLNLTTSVYFSESQKKQYANQRDVISRGLSCPPTQRLYNDDGTPTRGYNAAAPNPVFYAYNNEQSQKYSYLNINGSLEYNITNDLYITVQGSIYKEIYQDDYFEKANIFNGARTASTSFNDLKRKKLETYLTYNKQFFDVHSFSAVAGYSYQNEFYKQVHAEADGGSSDIITTLNGSPNKIDASSTFEEQVMIGYFGRLAYDYKKKYMLNLTLRIDGSSLFAAGNQWGYFPGMSVGWNIAEEPFMKRFSNISLLKFRSSYGETGNNNIGLYDALGRYSADYKYNGESAIMPVDMPNTNLTWETTNQFDLGLELGLFSNRISLSADYFDKITKNLLFSKTLPNTTGFSTVESNIGKVKFYGFDIDIITRNIQTTNFTWQTQFIWSFVKNRVLELPDNGNDKNRIGGTSMTMADGSIVMYGGTAEGEPLYRFYGYKTDGILETQEAADNALYDNSSKGFRQSDGKSIKGRKEVGDYEWKDLDGDGKITSVDQFELGVSVPHTTGSLNNTFTYKNFVLNVNLDWALGHSVYEESYSRYFLSTFELNYALVEGVKNCWTHEGQNAKYARFTANDSGTGNANFLRKSDVFTYKADYLCIRDVVLQYKLKTARLKRVGVQQLILTLSGNNLYYLTALEGGASPEVGASTTYSTTGYSNYPPIRRYALGVKITF